MSFVPMYGGGSVPTSGTAHHAPLAGGLLWVSEVVSQSGKEGEKWVELKIGR